jgi:hypothetical protein
MMRTLRWTLRIAGWTLVVLALFPRWISRDGGPDVERRLTLGLPASPLFERETTVIHAGVANVPEEQPVKWSYHFAIDSLSMLALIVGALLVSASNRRAVR